MPNETSEIIDQPSPGEMDRMESDYKANMVRAVRAAREMAEAPGLPPEALAAGITAEEWGRYLKALDSPEAEQSTNATIAHDIFKDKAQAFLNYQPGNENQPEPSAEPPQKVEVRRFIRSDEKRAAIAHLAREAFHSGDPEAFWQKPEIRQRAAALGMDIPQPSKSAGE